MKIAVKNRWHSKIRNLIEDENEDLCDISFKLTDEDGHKTILKCHKFVLALASPVFKTQFYGALEVRDEEIEIKDGNAEIFRDLINFIYKEEHFEKFSNIINPEVLRDVLHLCYFAEKYQMADLLDYLHSVINHSININSNNVFLFLESIEEYNYLHREYAIIKEKCFGFIDKNVKVFLGQNSDQNASTVGNGLAFGSGSGGAPNVSFTPAASAAKTAPTSTAAKPALGFGLSVSASASIASAFSFSTPASTTSAGVTIIFWPN